MFTKTFILKVTEKESQYINTGIFILDIQKFCKEISEDRVLVRLHPQHCLILSSWGFICSTTAGFKEGQLLW